MKIIINGEVVDVGSDGGNENVYSTEEIRIGTWIDGKPLYRKVIYATTPGNDTLDGIFSLSKYAIDKVISLSGFVNMKSGSVSFFNTSGLVGNTSAIWILRASVNSKNEVSIQTTVSDAQSCPATLILEYTKTTDEPTAS